MILELSKNVTIDRMQDGLPIGELLFRKSKFSLFVSIENFNSLKDRFDIHINILRQEDEAVLRRVGDVIQIRKEGRPSSTILNQTEYDNYVLLRDGYKEEISTKTTQRNNRRTSLETERNLLTANRGTLSAERDELKTLQGLANPTQEDLDRIEAIQDNIPVLLNVIDENEGNVKSLTNQVKNLNEQIQTAREELSFLVEVVPEFEMIDTFDEVVGLYVVNNKLTEEGLAWLRPMPFEGETLNDYIV